MVRIRLRRVGGKKQPSYRIIAADREAPRDGRFLEILGFYNPRTQPETIEVVEDRIYDWISKGAQPSDSVAKLFTKIGLLERYERLKKGEALETLLAEAKAAESARQPSPKTSYPPSPKQSKTE
ncbi:MAG: 30S ribosomal protein S16 [Anaerolineales bacterium]|nr:30S ribosomal protein S16 [Anaerolineales bacterium]